jgi:hypothetical protein
LYTTGNWFYFGTKTGYLRALLMHFLDTWQNELLKGNHF